MGPGTAREPAAVTTMPLLNKAPQGRSVLHPRRQLQRANMQLMCGALGAEQVRGIGLSGPQACGARDSYQERGRGLTPQSNSIERTLDTRRKRALFTRCTGSQAAGSGPSSAEASTSARADEASDRIPDTTSEEEEPSSGNGSFRLSSRETGSEAGNGAWEQGEEGNQRREGATAELDQGWRLDFQTAEEIPIGVDGREPREPLGTSAAPLGDRWATEARQDQNSGTREGDAKEQDPGVASEAGKGAAFSEESGAHKPAAGPFRRFRHLLRALLSVMPYGSWWQVGHREGPQGRRLVRSLQQLWSLAKADTGLLALATLFLALAAVSRQPDPPRSPPFICQLDSLYPALPREKV